jgi:hypothetical protein
MKAMWTFLIGLALWAPITYLRGYVVVRLWEWFVTPLSPNLPPPTIYAAVGVMFVIHAAWPRPRLVKENDAEVIIASILWPLTMLGFGAVWHWLAWGM